MKLSELKSGQGKVDIEVKVKSKAEPRQFEKYGKVLRVANAIVEDESGTMTLSLWNDDVDKVNEGDKIKITNGYVSEFNGTKQLTSGKFGKLEVVYDKK
jgi:replication factor A1